ncbi:helix-turn-helix transcriptional regulator [Kitasatospora purpeofusca]|uniref:helix-turn-helix domain-containing protein n=1 Tax=Kitasatospora purpeofusca TaxID=67352 RepID=UPI002A59D919|nr:helix-turn-helix transcriptional regulator [Kitasatospora purpeofusca]MDY0811738.1 helix-turn-helix transcriptional regulator [Kitasatospora purpeofusca]
MNERKLDPTSSAFAPIGVQLRRSRKARSLTQPQLGEMIRFSASYISRIERGVEPPSRRLAQEVDQALDTGGTIELMLDQLEHVVLKEGLPEYVAQEAKAVTIRLFHLGLISGLLQTPDYATAYELASVRRGAATRQQADARVKFLLNRQEALKRAPPPFIQAVLDEWNLRRPIGGDAVMIGQLKYLEEVAQQPNVTLQVAPMSLGEDRPFVHPVNLLTMPNGRMVGYTESHKTGFMERDAQILSSWARDYDRLQVEALSRAGSLELIRAVRKEFESHAAH